MEWNGFVGNGLEGVFWLVWGASTSCMVHLVYVTDRRWITKQEYEEFGKDWNLLQKRCP